MTEPRWDCNYPTWHEGFAPTIPATPFTLAPSAPAGEAALSDWLTVERHGETWVVRKRDGSYWCDLLDNSWTDDPDDEVVPAIRFPSREAAVRGFIQADRMYGERADRRRAAIRALGREADE